MTSLHPSIARHRLRQGLRLTTHCTPDAKCSEVIIAVRAGHFFDPTQCQGLAHLLEHMLFLGSLAMPSPNQIFFELDKLGAKFTAATGFETVLFHLTCSNEHFSEALLRVVQLITQPLFIQERIDKEIDNIHEEFLNNINDVGRGFHDVRRTLFNPQHPASQFSVGNHSTFRQHSLQDIKQLLLTFHHTHYVAENICIGIQSEIPHQQLVTLVEDAFYALPKGKLATLSLPPLFMPQVTPLLVNICNPNVSPHLNCHFSLALATHSPLQSMIDVLILWLGDESQDTLIDWLKEQEYATSVTASRGLDFYNYSEIVVTITLTQKGLRHHLSIINALFAYLRHVDEGAHEKWRYQQAVEILTDDTADLDLRHLVLQTLTDDISEHDSSPSMRLPDEEAMKALLKMMAEENCRFFLTHDDAPTQRQSPFYQVPFSVSSLPCMATASDKFNRIYEQLRLPPPNPFLSGNTEKYNTFFPESDLTPIPLPLSKASAFNAWWITAEDTHEKRGDIYLSIEHPRFMSSSANTAAKRIALWLLTEHIKRRFYNAEIAGLKHRLYGHQAGFTLHVYGPLPRLMSFFLYLLEQIKALRVNPQQFAKARDYLVNQCHHHLYTKPINRLLTHLTSLVQANTYAPYELAQALELLSFDDFISEWQPFDGKAFAECFLHGNWSVQTSNGFISTLSKMLPLGAVGPLPRNITRFGQGTTTFFSLPCEQKDAALVLYLQPSSGVTQKTLFCMLLEQLLATPFFDRFRTTLQMGYQVGSGYIEHNRYPGIVFYAQSAMNNCSQLLDKMISCLAELLPTLEQYRQGWTDIKHTLSRQVQPRHYPSRARAQYLWANIDKFSTYQALSNDVLEALDEYSFEEFINDVHQLTKKRTFAFVVIHTDSADQLDNTINNNELKFNYNCEVR